ncbi:MAG: DUF177 domain-containing protein [Bacteroidetes bacterium]|nr:DUF177 domain-containing protein [Bacteroidota bacterium]
MKINISNLSEGVHEYDFEETSSSIELDERFSKPVVVRVELEKRRRQLFLTAHVKTSGRFACDRCLEDFDTGLELDYRMTYVYEMNDAEGLDQDEVTVIHASTNVIDIAEDVRDYILLAVPMKLLCKDDCAGLCRKCGKNLNHGPCICPADDVDPRWEKLKQIMNKN